MYCPHCFHLLPLEMHLSEKCPFCLVTFDDGMAPVDSGIAMIGLRGSGKRTILSALTAGYPVLGGGKVATRSTIKSTERRRKDLIVSHVNQETKQRASIRCRDVVGSNGLGNCDQFVVGASHVLIVIDTLSESRLDDLAILSSILSYEKQLQGVETSIPFQSAGVIFSKVEMAIRGNQVLEEDYIGSKVDRRSSAVREWALKSRDGRFANFIKNVEDVFDSVEFVITGGLINRTFKIANRAWIDASIETLNQNIWRHISQPDDALGRLQQNGRTLSQTYVNTDKPI
jgi:hypothetical protein